jgi:hypothetical protein
LSLAAFVGALDAYLHRPDRFCRQNYERIRVGMPLAEVEALLGCPAKEIVPEDSPLSSDFSQSVSPEWAVPVVSGDQLYRFEAPQSFKGGEVIVGLEGGRVCDKWYWEESLSFRWARDSHC